MSALYDRLRGTASTLIERFGQAMTLTRTLANGTLLTLVTRGVVVGTVKHQHADSGISIGDDRLLLDADVIPKPADRIAYNGQSRVLVDPVISTNPGGTLLVFECYARTG